jgi:hypothetical protein
VKILPPSLSPERVKVDDFYAARSGLIPPLPWSTFSPPFSIEFTVRDKAAICGFASPLDVGFFGGGNRDE